MPALHEWCAATFMALHVKAWHELRFLKAAQILRH
jgi:hypothetical protein